MGLIGRLRLFAILVYSRKTGGPDSPCVVYKGPDGRIVNIKPDGEVVPIQKVWNATRTEKLKQRQDREGNPLPELPREPGATRHPSTGHYLEPL